MVQIDKPIGNRKSEIGYGSWQLRHDLEACASESSKPSCHPIFTVLLSTTYPMSPTWTSFDGGIQGLELPLFDIMTTTSLPCNPSLHNSAILIDHTI